MDMRAILAVSLITFFSMNAFAVEPVNEQQIMFYYHIPLGADKQHSKHQFGLRLDQTSHDPRESVQIDSLVSRPAVMDFRMNYDGVQSINFSGVNYAKYLIAKAAEGDEPPVETPDDTVTEDAATDDTAAEPETAQAEEKPKEEVGPVGQAIMDAPVGVTIGVIVGLLILAGAGG